MLNRYIIGTLLWAGGILLLTLTPGQSMPDVGGLFSYDKLGHAFVFFVLSALMSKGIFEAGSKKVAALIITLVITTFYGMAIEIGQQFIPDRGMEWFDALANVIGSFLGVLVFYIMNMQKA